MEPEFPSAQLYLNSLVLEEQQDINEGCWLIPGGGGLHCSEPGWPFRSRWIQRHLPKMGGMGAGGSCCSEIIGLQETLDFLSWIMKEY